MKENQWSCPSCDRPKYEHILTLSKEAEADAYDTDPPE